MGALVAKMIFKNGYDQLPYSEFKSLFDIPEVDIDGHNI
jgi:hypothetical protein